jgi:hypothetical protein
MSDTLQSIYGDMLASYPNHALRIREDAAPNGAFVIYSDEPISTAQITEALDRWQGSPTDSQGYHVVDLREG